jgi:hypothetical protein
MEDRVGRSQVQAHGSDDGDDQHRNVRLGIRPVSDVLFTVGQRHLSMNRMVFDAVNFESLNFKINGRSSKRVEGLP